MNVKKSHRILSIIIITVFALQVFLADISTAGSVEIIIDNTSTGFTSSNGWTLSTLTPGHYGINYITTQTAGEWAKWTPTVTVAGQYNIYLKYSGRAESEPPAVPLEISYNGGIDSQKAADMNNVSLKLQWVYIGTYPLATGIDAYVKLTSVNTGGTTTAADAVKFELAYADNTIQTSTSSPASLVVDENTLTNNIDGSLFGISNEFTADTSSPSIYMQNTTTTELSTDFSVKAAESGLYLPLNRIAGTSSQEMQWKKAIGTMAERTAQKMWSWEPNTKQSFGPVEWIKAIRNVDNNASFTWTLNIARDTPQDCADLVEFLTGDGKTNPGGGINWAQRRLELGIEKPVNIAVWELGNEMDIAPWSWTVEQYIAACQSVIAAIRAVYPDAKFAAHSKTSPWGNIATWRNWHQTVINNLGNDINYISFHAYYLGISLNYIESFLNTITTDIGSKPIRLFVSEHAVWPSDKDNQSTWPETHNLEGLLGTAEFINRMNRRTDISFATLHNISSGPWGIIYRTSNTYWKTGLADMFSLYNQSIGKGIKYTLSGDLTASNRDDGLYYSSVLSGMVAEQDNGLAIILVNRSGDQKRQVSFSANNKYRLVKSRVLTAPNITDYNTVSNTPISITDRFLSVTGCVGQTSNLTTLTVPPKSMVLYILKPIPGSNSVVYDGASFSSGTRLIGGNITTTFYGCVGGSTAKPAKAYVALYNKGSLEKVQITNLTLSPGASSVTTLPMVVPDANGRTVKAFLWQDSKPLGSVESIR